MARCKSWTPVPGWDGPIDWPPSPRSKAWRICLNPVAPGQTRCPDCASILATHPDIRVRRALVNEPDLEQGTLQLLLADSEPDIAQTASRRLGTYEY